MVAHELDLGEPAGAVGQPHRPPAVRGVRVRAEQVDQPLPRQLEQVVRRRALRDQRRGRLHERALLDERREAVVEVDAGMALGMRDHAAKPAVGEPLDRVEQVLPERARPRLDQQPPAVAERDALEHLVGELVEHRLGDLARRDHAHVEALALELLVDGVRPALQLVRDRPWSGWMCGVAQISLMPSLSATRAISTLSARSRAPSSSSGRMWQWRSITA